METTESAPAPADELDVLPQGWPERARLLTPRLRLEPVRVEHAAAMTHVLAGPALYRVIGGRPPIEAELREHYRRWRRSRSADGSEGWLNWIMLRRGGDPPDATGTVQATTTRSAGRWIAELAWIVGVAQQRRGFATEGAQGVVAWLREAGCGSSAHTCCPDTPPASGSPNDWACGRPRSSWQANAVGPAERRFPESLERQEEAGRQRLRRSCPTPDPRGATRCRAGPAGRSHRRARRDRAAAAPAGPGWRAAARRRAPSPPRTRAP